MPPKYQKAKDADGVVHIFFGRSGFMVCALDWDETGVATRESHPVKCIVRGWFEPDVRFDEGPSVTCIACLALVLEQES